MKKMIIMEDDKTQQIRLQQIIRDENGQHVAQMQTYLNGDGETPVVTTIGGIGRIEGYNDDGTPITSKADDELIVQEQKKFMAAAIKEQKALCIEKGVDPDLVNILNAEKQVVKDEQ